MYEKPCKLQLCRILQIWANLLQMQRWLDKEQDNGNSNMDNSNL